MIILLRNYITPSVQTAGSLIDDCEDIQIPMLEKQRYNVFYTKLKFLNVVFNF